MAGVFTNPNDKVFYACQAVLTKSRMTTQSGGSDSPTNSSVLKGVQSVGVDREVNRNSYLDVGRMQQLYGSYSKPIYTITISRVLDKADDFFFNVTGQTTYEDGHILNDTNGIGFNGISDKLRNYDISLLYSPDDVSYVGADNGLVQTTTYRCCLLTSISYTISVSGAVTEDLTFTSHSYTQNDETDSTLWTGLNFTHSGSTLTRKDVSLANCTFPKEVTRMFDLSNSLNSIDILGLQQISVNVEIEYNDLKDVGVWRGSTTDRAEANLFKQINLPISVSCEFSGVVRAQYFTEATQNFEVTDTHYSQADNSEAAEENNYKADRQIIIAAEAGSDYFQWNLGARNYLTAMNFSGGDSQGGNVEGSVGFANNYSEVFLTKASSINQFSFTNNLPY